MPNRVPSRALLYSVFKEQPQDTLQPGSECANLPFVRFNVKRIKKRQRRSTRKQWQEFTVCGKGLLGRDKYQGKISSRANQAGINGIPYAEDPR
jgi:hypothetical protein